MNGVRLPAALSLCIALGFAAGPAQPSQRLLNGQMIPDPLEYPLDPIPPVQPVIAVESIERAYGTIRTDSLRVDNSDCCTATITLLVSGAHDNGTQARKLGYRYHFIDGTLPGNFDLPKGAWLADHGHLWLTWDDGGAWKRDAFSFRLAVTAVDHAGNESARSNIIRIEHDGDTSAKRRDVESRLGVWSGETMPSPAAGADTLLKGPDDGGSVVGVGPVPLRIRPGWRREVQPDPTLRDIDTTPPSRVTISGVQVHRGYGGTWFDGNERAWYEGENLGTIQIRHGCSEDDQTPVNEIGYLVRIVDGNPPAGLVFPPDPIAGFCSEYYARWDDGDTWSQDPFAIRIVMTTFDSAGNESAPSDTLSISDDGSNRRRRMERRVGPDSPEPPRIRRIVASVIADRDTVTTGDTLVVEVRVENQGSDATTMGFTSLCMMGLQVGRNLADVFTSRTCAESLGSLTISAGRVFYVRYKVPVLPQPLFVVAFEGDGVGDGFELTWPSSEGRVVPGTYELIGGVFHERYPAGRKVIVVR